MKSLYFGTRHGKEEVVAPFLSQLGYQVEAVPIDSDQLGTFAGEVERRGSVAETLRKKIEMTRALRPGGRFFLASEGTFLPHPRLPVVSANLESLLWFDAQLEHGVYSEAIEPERGNRQRQVSLDPQQARLEADLFLKEMDLRSQSALVLMKDSSAKVVMARKGLSSHFEVQDAVSEMIDLARRQDGARVVVSADLRAFHSLARRQVIALAAQVLVRHLSSLCPSCEAPGFRAIAGILGLPCEACGEETTVPKAEIWECSRCLHSESRPFQEKSASPEFCAECNP